MQKIWASFLVLAVWLFIAVASGPAAVRSPSSQDSISKPSEAANREPWKTEWQKVLELGKKEGSVVIGSSIGSNLRQSLSKAFKAKYGIDLQYVTAPGGQLSEKLKRERTANIYSTDIIMTGTRTLLLLKQDGVLEPIEPSLILPEVKDTKGWYGGKIPFLDSENYVVSFGLVVDRPLAINTQLVKPDEIKSYRDLLRPKWKGKIAMADPSIGGTALSFFTAIGEYLMGYDYLRELAKQKPFLNRNAHLIADWGAKGKYAILIGISNDRLADFQKAGAPLMFIIPPKEGSYLKPGGSFTIVNRAPHPNATKVFTNWLLGKEGQTIYSQVSTAESAREDVPKGHIDTAFLRKPGIKYVYAGEEFQMLADRNRKLALEIFGPLMK